MFIKKMFFVIAGCFFLAQNVSGIELSEKAQAVIKQSDRVFHKKNKIYIYETDRSNAAMAAGLIILGVGGVVGYLGSPNEAMKGYLLGGVIGGGFLAYSLYLKSITPSLLLTLEDDGITFAKDKKKILWTEIEDVERIGTTIRVDHTDHIEWDVVFTEKIKQDAKASAKISAKKAERSFSVAEDLLPISGRDLIALVAEYLDEKA